MKPRAALALTLALALAACGPEASRSSLSRGASVGSAGARFEGLASWYSDSLAGRPTASGAPYDPGALTAAHRSLPFGTRLLVERADTGASVEVRVTDRGPFGDARRVVDLSRAAATALSMLRAGVVPVRVVVLELGAPRARGR